MNPKALASSLTGLNNNPVLLNSTFASHAIGPDRLRKLHKAAKGFHGHERYLVTTSDFDQIKARLVLINNRRTAVEPKRRERHPGAWHQN